MWFRFRTRRGTHQRIVRHPLLHPVMRMLLVVIYLLLACLLGGFLIRRAVSYHCTRNSIPATLCRKRASTLSRLARRPPHSSDNRTQLARLRLFCHA